MEMNIFIGAQAAGKSSFYKLRFSDTHIRINLDMLRKRNRERILIEACLNAKQSFVVDNTNATRAQRERYFELAKHSRCKVFGFYFQSITRQCIDRNRSRSRGPLPRVPEFAIRATVKQLELPDLDEGFDRLSFVRIDQTGKFIVEDWVNEV